jgi:quinoprotein glucose dehydrogenase
VNAIDLTKGEFAWRTVLGEYSELKAKGVLRTGTKNFGGVIVTAGDSPDRLRICDLPQGKGSPV